MVNTKELTEMFLGLEKWTRRNKDKITRPIRTKHFLEDVAYLIHWLDDDSINPKIQQWRNQSIPKHLIKLFGLKK